VGNVFKGKTVLFQGDSVTDRGRDRSDPYGLGGGYPARVAAVYNALFPGSGAVFLNRGISGNRVGDLLARYEADFLAPAPDVLSILIGINDTWRRYDNNDPTAPEAFEATYRTLLTRIRRDMPRVRLLLIEPFVLPVPPDRLRWREDLDPKIHAVRRLAAAFADAYLPADGLLAGYLAAGLAPSDIAADGVHPTDAGHGLLAGDWLRCAGVI
jgi:lysophospholipase L1-like esterase